MGTITRLLAQVNEGNSTAHEELFHYVYSDLRRLAQSLLREWPRARLEGTELVHMACLKLLAAERLTAESRQHFFFILGRAMKDVLADERRKSNSLKRGGDRQHMPLFDPPLGTKSGQTAMLDLSPALAELTRIDPDAGAVISLRIASGCSLREAARVLDVSLAKVRSDWTYAQAWLASRTGGEPMER